MPDLATYLAEANARIAQADKDAWASGLAFLRDPSKFVDHFQKVYDRELEEYYRELDNPNPSDGTDP